MSEEPAPSFRKHLRMEKEQPYTMEHKPTPGLQSFLPYLSQRGMQTILKPAEQGQPKGFATRPRAAVLLFFFLLSAFAGCEKDAPAGKKEESQPGNPAILFLGDSLTAGLGLEKSQAAPALIQEKLNKKGWDLEVINAGVSGDTTAGGLSRLDFYLKNRPGIEYLVIGLGSNDGMRGLDLNEMKKNLTSIVEKTRQHDSGITIFLYELRTFPNMGPEYASRFAGVFPELADEHNLHLIEFPLRNVASRRDLNQEDGIHPNAEGTKIMADDIWKDLEPILAKRFEAKE